MATVISELSHARQRCAVIDHVSRYRLAIAATLRQLPDFANCTSAKLRRFLRTLEAERIVGSQWLHHEMRCWYLAARGAQDAGLPTDRSGPLSESAKVRAYAMLRFCQMSERPRVRLTVDDIRQNFPDLYRSGMPQGYYFDPHGTGMLGLLRIDAGQRGRWDRVVHSLLEDINQHRKQTGFHRLIQAGRFAFTIATVLPQKADRIRGAMDQNPAFNNVAIQVVAIPELLPLIASTFPKEVRT
jgi:hypothetical protein